MNRLTGRQTRSFCYAVSFCLTAFHPSMAAMGLFLCLMDAIEPEYRP